MISDSDTDIDDPEPINEPKSDPKGYPKNDSDWKILDFKFVEVYNIQSTSSRSKTDFKSDFWPLFKSTLISKYK